MTPQAQGHLAMLLFSALVAGSFSLGGMVANDITPLALNAVRFVIAAIVLGIVAMVTTGIPRSALAAPWRYLVLGGLFIIYFVLMFEGLKTSAPVSSAAVFTLVPAMAGIFGWFLLRQRMTPRIAMALCFGGLGALWVIFRADLAAVLAFDVGRGEVIFFFGCIAHAIYTPLVRVLNRGESALVFAFGTLVAGAILLMVLGARDIVATNWLNLRPLVWLTILYVAICASSITFVLVQFATMRLPSAKVMAYTYLVPVWVICWEVGLGNGLPPIGIVAGVVLTVLALLLLLRDEDGPPVQVKAQ
ncbi:DMT family transporter [Sulfitobacter guttiformis]|uniref:EamA-like transporter family protein n=1 Tax=Sulfitobacter guttiformis TaxID=74349 RepID=A0A420DQU8_9RHOB|nr:DMT family transporter [Sulfitobacter guttiformis]KIN73989.1 Integral membrane protein [Sulfitobacter guttiformis KCTC 32187]RKE96612.1 EamA-like transporter family protein [Sulfitobacter guttiformis]